MARARVTRVPATNKALAALPAHIRKAMDDVNKKSADELAALWDRNIPRESGDLASTIEVRRTPTRVNSWEVRVGNEEHDYAAALEWGHMKGDTHVPPQPFAVPAIKVVRKKHRTRARRAVNKAVKNGPKGGDA